MHRQSRVPVNSDSIPNHYLVPVLRGNPVAMSGGSFFLRGNEARDLMNNPGIFPGHSAKVIGSQKNPLIQFRMMPC